MSESRQEEVISILWIIASLQAFGSGHSIWGWVFAGAAGFGTVCAILLALTKRN